jgi:hypothetical protein
VATKSLLTRVAIGVALTVGLFTPRALAQTNCGTPPAWATSQGSNMRDGANTSEPA